MGFGQKEAFSSRPAGPASSPSLALSRWRSLRTARPFSCPAQVFVYLLQRSRSALGEGCRIGMASPTPRSPFFTDGGENTAFPAGGWKLKAKHKLWALATLKRVLGLQFNPKEVSCPNLGPKPTYPSES